MMVYTMLSLSEFEELCLTRLETAQWKIKLLRENMESGSAQSYEKTVAELDTILTQLTRVKLDMESTISRFNKESSNDKN